MLAAQVKGALRFDMAEFDSQHGDKAFDDYVASHTLKQFGKRRVEMLHETGQCGTRYGFKLMRGVNAVDKSPENASVVVMGYGNVACGGIHEAFDAGARVIHVLGRTQVKPENIEKYLSSADLIVNGIDLPERLAGKLFVITREHTQNVIRPGTVVIDLVGGSKNERSAVENIVQFTSLNNPSFEEHGVHFSAIWGWPMVGMMRESSLRYSTQIADLLIGPEKIINGLDS